MINRHLPQPAEMRQPFGIDGREYGAESRQTFQQMSRNLRGGPAVAYRRGPVEPVRRQQAQKVLGPLDLLVNFRQYRSAKQCRHVSSKSRTPWRRSPTCERLFPQPYLVAALALVPTLGRAMYRARPASSVARQRL